MIPSCQDVEHTCPHCIRSFFLTTADILGGFLMARYRRGTEYAKVYPVDQGYSPVGQPVNPSPEFSQQNAVTESVKK